MEESSKILAPYFFANCSLDLQSSWITHMKHLLNKAYGRAEVQSDIGCKKLLQSAKAGSHCTSFCSNLYSVKRVLQQEGCELNRS